MRRERLQKDWEQTQQNVIEVKSCEFYSELFEELREHDNK